MENEFDKNNGIYKVMSENYKKKKNLISKREKSIRSKYLSGTLAIASAISSLIVAYPTIKKSDMDKDIKNKQEVKEYFVKENQRLAYLNDGTYVAEQEALDTFLSKELKEEYNKKSIASIDKEISNITSSEKYKNQAEEKKSRRATSGILGGLALLLGIASRKSSKKSSSLERQLEWMDQD